MKRVEHWFVGALLIGVTAVAVQMPDSASAAGQPSSTVTKPVPRDTPSKGSKPTPPGHATAPQAAPDNRSVKSGRNPNHPPPTTGVAASPTSTTRTAPPRAVTERGVSVPAAATGREGTQSAPAQLPVSGEDRGTVVPVQSPASLKRALSAAGASLPIHDRTAAVPLAMLTVLGLFLLAQTYIDRRDPKLRVAHVGLPDELEFSLPRGLPSTVPRSSPWRPVTCSLSASATSLRPARLADLDRANG